MLLAPLRRRAVTGLAGITVSVVLPFASAVVATDTAAAAPAAEQVRTVGSADSAANATAARRAKHRKQVRLRKARRIVKIAARYKGRPYRWGAGGPSAFDCSGYTQFVVRRAIGKYLPHNSAAQSRSGKVDRVKRKNKRRGDLVFFYGGGRVHHVGIYAGKGKMWHSPRPGRRVTKDRIYSSKVFFGRVV